MYVIARNVTTRVQIQKQESCAIAKMTARCALYVSASHVSLQSRTSQAQQGLLFRFLVSPKFPHVPWE